MTETVVVQPGDPTVGIDFEPGRVDVVFDDLGSGAQIARIRTDDLTLEFAQEPMWTLYWWDVSGGSEDAAIDSDDWGTPQTGNGTNGATYYKWTNATTGSRVTIEFFVRKAYRDVLILGTVDVGSGDSGRSVHALDVNLRTTLFGTSTDNYLAVPHFAGLVLKDPASIPTDVVYSYPGFFDIDSAGGAHLGMQWASIYSESTRQGFIVRGHDPRSRPKAFVIGGSTDGLSAVVRCRFFPQGRKVRGGTRYSSDFGFSIHPRIGEWWDDCVYHRWASLHEGFPPARGRGPLSTTSTSVSPVARDMRVFYWGNSTEFVDPSFPDLDVDVLRGVGYFGTTDLFFSGYQWQRYLGGNLWPDITPVRTGSADALANINAAGADFGVYTFPNAVNPTSVFYGASDPSLDGYCIQDEDGNYIERLLGSTGTVADRTHRYLNFIHQLGNEETIQHWVDEIAANYPNIRGFYLDVAGGRGPVEDYNANLADDAKGYGRTTWTDGKRDWMSRIATKLQSATSSDSILLIEHTDETTLDVVEFQSAWSWLASQPTFSYLPFFRTAWGQYVRMVSYHSPGAHVGVNSSGGVASLNAWAWLLDFHFGLTFSMTIAYQSSGIRYQVPDESDGNYWARSWELSTLALMKTLCVDSWDVLAPWMQYGQRLRPLPNSYERHIVANGHSFTTIDEDPRGVTQEDGFRLLQENGDALLVDEVDIQSAYPDPSAPPMSSVWLAGGEILVIVTNHFHDTEKTFAVEMDAGDYPWLDGRHEIHSLTTTTGATTLLETFTDSFSRSVSLSALGSAAFVIKEAATEPSFRDGDSPLGTFVESNFAGAIDQETGDGILQETGGSLLLDAGARNRSIDFVLAETGDRVLTEDGLEIAQE